MKKIITCVPILAALTLIVGCGSYGFRQTTETDPISSTVESFVVIKYNSYADKDHALTGTVDQIAVRNDSESELRIELISLIKIFRNSEVNTETPYSVYKDGDYFSGVVSRDTSVPPGEWRYFVFPTKQIKKFKEGEVMSLNLAIKILGIDRTYENEVSFEKRIEKYSLPWP